MLGGSEKPHQIMIEVMTPCPHPSGGAVPALSDVTSCLRGCHKVDGVVDTAALFNGQDQAVVAHAVVSMLQFRVVALQL